MDHERRTPAGWTLKQFLSQFHAAQQTSTVWGMFMTSTASQKIVTQIKQQRSVLQKEEREKKKMSVQGSLTALARQQTRSRGWIFSTRERTLEKQGISVHRMSHFAHALLKLWLPFFFFQNFTFFFLAVKKTLQLQILLCFCFFFFAETAHSYRSSQVIIFTEVKVGAKLQHKPNRQEKSAGSCKKNRENTFPFPFPSVPVFSSACCVYTHEDWIVHVHRYLLCIYTHMHTCTITLYICTCVSVFRNKKRSLWAVFH